MFTARTDRESRFRRKQSLGKSVRDNYTISPLYKCSCEALELVQERLQGRDGT